MHYDRITGCRAIRLYGITKLNMLLVCFGCSSSRCSSESSNDVSRIMLDECERIMMCDIPTSAEGLNYLLNKGMDDTIYLKLRLPREDLDIFINKSPFKDVALRTDRRYPYWELDKEWWDLDKPILFQSGEALLPKAKYLNILIDLDDPKIVIIYLCWLET